MTRLVLVLSGVLAVGVPGPALGQESKSEPLARELARLMDEAQLDAIAARDPQTPDGFVAALYFPGSSLLLVSARYAVPPLLTEKIERRDYRDVYIDLHSASIPDSKTFVQDQGLNGLQPRREENHPFDTYDRGALSLVFDGDWKKQRIPSEAEYLEAYEAADAQYARLLTVLVGQLRKSSE